MNLVEFPLLSPESTFFASTSLWRDWVLNSIADSHGWLNVNVLYTKFPEQLSRPTLVDLIGYVRHQSFFFLAVGVKTT